MGQYIVMDLGITDKKVLITGASQGLGRAIAIDFAKEGCKVAIVARNADKLKELIVKIGGESKGHSYYAIDLMDDGIPTFVVEEFFKRYGHFDIVVHNVGGTLNLKNSLAPVEEWKRVWQYNVGIGIEINALVIPPMQKQHWGRVIHISSISAETVRGSGPYAASKSYLNAYVKSLGRSVAPTGVVVSALMPGAFISEGGHWDKILNTNPDMIKDFIRHHQAIGRLGAPEEISPFVIFMASQFATFASASIIPIDGGTM